MRLSNAQRRSGWRTCASAIAPSRLRAPADSARFRKPGKVSSVFALGAVGLDAPLDCDANSRLVIENLHGLAITSVRCSRRDLAGSGSLDSIVLMQFCIVASTKVTTAFH